MMIPFSKPSLDDQEALAVAGVLASGWLAAGKETELFEQEFSDYITPKQEDTIDLMTGKWIVRGETEPYYCIFTNSCTSALKMAYKWLIEDKYGFVFDNTDDRQGIQYPANTFCATYSAASELGLHVLPYEEAAETDYDYDRVNVHYGSVKDTTPCLIEDSAHRIEPNDPLVSKIRCYSFGPSKNMTTGSGGMFVTNQKEIYDKARHYWRDGRTRSTYEQSKVAPLYAVEGSAGGYDANDIAAAIGRVQLKKLPGFTRRRNTLVQLYNQTLGRNWQGNHLYCYDAGDTQNLAGLIEYLQAKGIQVSYHYPTIDGQYRKDWPYVSLPLYPDLKEEEVLFICKEVKRYEQGHRKDLLSS